MAPSLDVQLFWFSFWAYLIGWLSFTVWLAARKKIWTTIGSLCFAAGFVPQTIAFFLRWNNTGHIPMSNMYEYMAVMSWMAVGSFAFLTWRYKNWVISALISPVVIMLMVAASLLPKDPSQQLMPALRSSWLMIHVTLASVGAGAFAVAAAVSFVYLLAVRSEEETKKTFRPVMRIPFIVLVVIPAIIAIFGNVSDVFGEPVFDATIRRADVGRQYSDSSRGLLCDCRSDLDKDVPQDSGNRDALLGSDRIFGIVPWSAWRGNSTQWRQDGSH